MVSESVPHLRRGALRDFLKIMKQTNRYIPEHYNKTHLKYEFSNGSFIEFFSADDEGKLRGARRNILYVNEANNIPYEAYNQLAIRTNGDIYLDFNPTHRFYAHTEILKEDDSELLILTYKDNEALDNNIIKEFEIAKQKAKTSEYWRNWVDVYVYGRIGILEGVIFNNWSKIDYLPEEAELIGVGLDFGYTNDPTACVAMYRLNDSIIVDEVFYMKGLSNSDISRLLKDHKIVGEIIADSAEPKSIAELKRYGHKIMGVVKGKDSINFGISLLQEKDILITSSSKNVIDEFTKYSWKKDKEGKKTNYPEDINNHSIDALRYVAMMKLRKAVSRKTFKIL